MRRSRAIAERRAELALHLYRELGPRRSLTKLAQRLQAVGMPISLPTLKRYSARFGWQARIAALDAAASERMRERAADELLAMVERHAGLARAAQSAGGSALQALLADGNRLANLKPADIARLLDLGLRAERDATGAAVTRREIALEAWNTVTVEVVWIFTDVNREPDPTSRARLFARALDATVTGQLEAVAAERN